MTHLVIKGKEYPIEEARELYEELDQIFGYEIYTVPAYENQGEWPCLFEGLPEGVTMTNLSCPCPKCSPRS